MEGAKPVYPTYKNGDLILVEEDRTRAYLDRYPIGLLVNEPHRIRKMNTKDCKAWLDKHRNKRVLYLNKKDKIQLKPIRDQILQRLDDIKQAKKELEGFRKFEELLRQFCNEINWFTDDLIANPRLNKNKAFKVFGGRHRNTVFDMVSVKMGLYTVDAWEKIHTPTPKGHKKYIPTEEHCYPRSAFATDLVTNIYNLKLSNPQWKTTLKDILIILYEACFVVLSTKEENDKLKSFQERGTFSTVSKAYKQAGIKLVDTGAGIIIPWQWNYMFKRFDIDSSLAQIPHFEDVIPVEHYEQTKNCVDKLDINQYDYKSSVHPVNLKAPNNVTDHHETNTII